MVKLILLVVLMCLAAFGLAWLADRPGDIAFVWLGYRIETQVLTVAVGILLLIPLSYLVIDLLLRLRRGPEAIGLFRRMRRREKGLQAIERGLVAVGAGDTQAAIKAANEAEHFLGHDPMTLLLRSQAAQLSGDRTAAIRTFQRMLEAPTTKALGLRGLYVEAQRAGDAEAARRYASNAVALRPGIPWAAHAALAFEAGAKEWDAALDTIKRNADHRLIDRAVAKRLRAVVLTAKAMEAEHGDRARARPLALEAHGLAPDLVPAAVLAARLLSEAGEVKKSTRILETTWKLGPHPELGDAYMHARMGDSARDRLRRARALAELAPHHPESALVVAHAAMEARDFEEARRILKPLAEAPTQRLCLVMAQLAEAEGHVGEAREWLGRSVSAAADPAWTADGYVSAHWLPVSPVTAKLDAFQWRVPVEAAPGATIPSVVLPVIPEPIETDAPALSAPEASITVPADTVVVPRAAPATIAPVTVAPAIEEPMPAEAQVSTESVAETTTTSAHDEPEDAADVAQPAPPKNVVRLPIIPDDPGPEPRDEPEGKPRRFGLF